MDGTPISAVDKSYSGRIDNIDSAYLMQALVSRYHTEQLVAFPRELMLAICWEESLFQNLARFSGSAIGYGQLESAGLRIANQHLLGKLAVGEGAFTKEAILASRESSILVISHCLAGLYERLGNSAEAALIAYAGQQNLAVVERWQACAQALQKLPAEFDPLAFEAALQQARPFEETGPVYHHIHTRLWPLQDVLDRLKGPLQVGACGAQVRLLQEALNRLLITQATLIATVLPLTVDGDFGPKTLEAVKAYQYLRELPTNGIVDELTLRTLRQRTKTYQMI
ncbi:peptidoglycan-binding domain-containing protein [Uliginosibacterium gangwonense]|uniref:peptidoglycan-binding domain-containing protein n=1 Tax=Uliginosibacterium gangwonense TaxID=392736 RepID=UPI0003796A28|nr:peptidoglycan-binding domain-containing protein [Uliginosibacterium gangwonense]